MHVNTNKQGFYFQVLDKKLISYRGSRFCITLLVGVIWMWQRQPAPEQRQ